MSDTSFARSPPPLRRVLVGFLLAPAVAALAYAVYAPAYAGVPSMTERVWKTAVLFAASGAYPPALVFGMPAYLLLRRRLSPKPAILAVAGAVVAVAPWLLAMLLVPEPNGATVGDCATVVDGRRTACGWLERGKILTEIAAFGAVGGVSFWLLAVADRRRPTDG